MEIAEIKEWLDWHVANIKERQAHMHLNNRICTYPPEDYIMIQGIKLVADLLGAELKEEDLGDYKRYSFMYGETQVVQMERIKDEK